MFEGYTLGDQRKFEDERGWKPHFSASTYCTAEVMLYREPAGIIGVLDLEILDAERVTGAPDCVGRRQGKWGTQVRPAADPSPVHAIQRGVKEILGWEVGMDKFHLAAVMGPWIHKATARLDGNILNLDVLGDQGELTPFQASMFAANVTGFELGGSGSYLKAMKDTRWVKLGDLVAERGSDQNYLYWVMLAPCIQMVGGEMPASHIIRYFGPGHYEIDCL